TLQMRLSQQACLLKSTLSGDDVFELNRFLVIELRLAHKLSRQKDINDHFVRKEEVTTLLCLRSASSLKADCGIKF
ncbi:MAG: hypothetical protein ACI9VT_004148, partial [Psychroserpens sp.]